MFSRIWIGPRLIFLEPGLDHLGIASKGAVMFGLRDIFSIKNKISSADQYQSSGRNGFYIINQLLSRAGNTSHLSNDNTRSKSRHHAGFHQI